LNSLQELVETHLNGIQPGELAQPPAASSNPYRTSKFKKLYKLQGDSQLRMIWQFSVDVWKNFEARPLDVFEVLMNDGREGSLQHYLQQRGWAHAYDSGSSKSDESQSKYATLYYLIISLTPAGEREIDEVVQTVFAYVNVIGKASRDEKKMVWDELRAAANAKFEYNGDGCPLNNTHYSARTLIQSPAGADLFTSEMLYQVDYKDKPFCDLVKEISPDKTLFIQYVSNLSGSIKKLEHSNLQYTVRDIPQSFCKKIEVEDLSFPEKNPFMTDRFHMETVIKPYEDSKPKLSLVHNMLHGLTIPKAVTEISLISTEGCQSPLERTMLSMLVNHLSMNMSGEVSCASRAGLYSVLRQQTHNSDASIISFTIIGFAEFIPELIQAFCNGLCKHNCTHIPNNSFEILKRSEISSYKDRMSSNQDIASLLFQRMSIGDFANEIDTLFTPQDVIQSDFEAFIARFKSSMTIHAVFEGNIDKDKVNYIQSRFLSKVEYEQFSSLKLYIPAVSNLLLGEQAVRIRLKEADMVANENNVVTNVYQVASSGNRSFQIAKIVANLINGRAFQNLRTVQQLGYAVGSGGPQNKDLPITLSIRILTPRGKYTPCEVSSRIDDFLDTFYEQYLKKMSEKEHVDALLKVHLEDHISLDEVQSWYRQNVSDCLPKRTGQGRFVGLRKLSYQVVSLARKDSPMQPKECKNCPICKNVQWVSSSNPLLEFARVNPNRSGAEPPLDYFISDIAKYHNDAFR